MPRGTSGATEERTHLDGPLTDVSGGISLGGDADAARERGAGLGAADYGTGDAAPFLPLGAVRDHAAAALGLHRRRHRHAALDRLCGQLGAVRSRRRIPQRPDADRAVQRPQPGLHRIRVQPAGLGGAGAADLERAGCTATTASLASCASYGCSEGRRTTACQHSPRRPPENPGVGS